ncbi:MAG: hypothetical protein KAJ19_21455, partial [Gammaproteobacteria bacterium]|nr:hypothetical protein [Gammaproteobacteria bacterium]
TGKHKDRKELRGKGKKKSTDKVQVSPQMRGMLVPEGMKGAQREVVEGALKGVTYEGLSQVRDHVAAALKDLDGPYAKGLAKSGYTVSRDALELLQMMLDLRLEDMEGRKYHSDVLGVANQYDLEGEDADALHEFKKDKPLRGKKITDEQLMQKFLSKAKPETRERMKGMSVADFMIAYKSIMDEEEEEVEAAA